MERHGWQQGLSIAGRIGLALAMAAIVFQSGCKRSDVATAPKEKAAAPRKLDERGIGFKSLTGDKVNSAVGDKDAELPDDFPADVPLYPKATRSIVAVGDNETTVILHTDDSLEKAVAVCKDELKKNGWEFKPTEVSKTTMLQGKKDGRALTIFLSVEAGKTSIRVVVPTKK